MGNNINLEPKSKLSYKIAKNYFDFLYVIGRGGFGKVWKVKLKKGKDFYALKEMSKVKIIDRKSERSIISERDLLSNLHHPFIVNMHYAFQDYENLYLVMDLLTGGDLRYQIFKLRKFSQEQAKFFIACLILGLEYIHSNKIIHRDIKPENLVCDKDGYIRITDFGIAKTNQKDNSSETSGTPGYMAPEVLFSQNHSYPVDFFAIGVIGYEFMYGVRPYLGKSRREIKDAVINKQVKINKHEVPSHWSLSAVDFINKLLQRKAENRLGTGGINELKSHPWMQTINWNDLYNHKLTSPFIPKQGDNFDKQYCEGQEALGDETIGRYQDYIQDSEYIELFNNYTYISNNKWSNPTSNSNNNNNIFNASNTNNIQVESTTQVSTPSSRMKITKNPFPRPLCNQFSTSSIFKQGSCFPGHSLMSQKEMVKKSNKVDLFLGKSISMKMMPKANIKAMEINCVNDYSNITERKKIKNAIDNNPFFNNFLTQQKQKNAFSISKKMIHPYSQSSNTSRPGSPSDSEDKAIVNDYYHKKAKALKTIDVDKNLPLISFIQRKFKNTNCLFSPISMKNIKDEHSLSITKSHFNQQKMKPKIKFDSNHLSEKRKFIGLHNKSNSASILEKLYKKSTHVMLNEK